MMIHLDKVLYRFAPVSQCCVFHAISCNCLGIEE